MTPDAMKNHLTKLKVLDQYDLARPEPRPNLKVTSDYVVVAEILDNSTGFVRPYAERAERVINGNGCVVHYSSFW
jgi:linoleate 10R-lipoxygenase